jgi:hypothetical protein
MTLEQSRRRFLKHAAMGAAGLYLAPLGSARPEPSRESSSGTPHKLTIISGKPRERGRLYGEKFKDGIHDFLNREIYSAFTGKPSMREQMLRYAGDCGKAVHSYSPEIHDELEGIAEGAGLKLEEAVLITSHEELYHRGVLPSVDHCTAIAAGPPYTRDGQTYVGQTWDWMASVYGLSSMLLWKRAEGPSLLAYGYPGLPCGAGLNSAGIALCWTSANDKEKIAGPRVGIPAYVLLTHLLYQSTLQDVVAEARRANQAGWFTFVMGDAEGNLLNIEGSPKELAVEGHRGRLVRVLYGSRQMTQAKEGEQPKMHARAHHTYDLIDKNKDQLDGAKLRGLLGDPQAGICVGKGTIDMMLFDCTARKAHVSRGPAWAKTWRTFKFESKEG